MAEQKQRPLILEIEEAKTEIITAVNKALTERGIPCYILSPIIRDVYTQVENGAKSELEAAKNAEKNAEQEAEK